ncbi:MAG: hypothetical protein AABX83_03120 [Nanoarchaeota archaeon]
MNIRFIRSSEKKRITANLNEQFGIEKLPYLLIESGKERIRGFSGSLSKDEIILIAQLTNVESIGIYLIKKEKERDLRLSLDAAHLLKDQINKNIVEINESQLYDWLRGKDLEIQTEKGNIIIQYKGDLIGSGKSNGERIFNYVPKDRRLRK